MSPEASLAAFVETERARVDRALDTFLPSPPGVPPLLADAMRYAVFAGGKRLRPVLALAAADAVAGPGADAAARELALPAACAIELIHTYSLVHDDLPAMDDDSMRRGKPTAHVRFGEGIAILAGDGLLTEAFALMARAPEVEGRPALTARKLRVLALVANAAGAAGMVGGQTIDLELAGAAGPVPTCDADGLRAMHARKTGALIRAAACAGAVMAGADTGTIAAVDAYANELGLAFQITDDILDVEGTAGTLGKTAGKDAAAGKPTYPALHGLETSRRLAADCVSRAHAALARAGLGGQLGALADWVLARSS